jgi:hypothetical protein
MINSVSVKNLSEIEFAQIDRSSSCCPTPTLQGSYTPECAQR